MFVAVLKNKLGKKYFLSS